MKKLVPVLIVFAVIYLFSGTDQLQQAPDSVAGNPASEPHSQRNAPSGAASPFISGRQARGSGTVVRVLSDDNDGSRHQRFILQVATGRTLLIAHNIDLAPRITGIREGDTVEFYGEFEANPQGGIIHWTHRDPNGQHAGGWLKHKGRTYQ